MEQCMQDSLITQSIVGGCGTFVCIDKNIQSYPLYVIGGSVKEKKGKDYRFGDGANIFEHRGILIERTYHPGRHDNLVPLVAVFEKEGDYFVFYKKLSERTARYYIRNTDIRIHAFDRQLLCKLIAGLCDGVTYIHVNLGLVHHDINPGNVFISFDRSKIWDPVMEYWILGDYESVNRANEAVIFGIYGTGPYTAPELLDINLATILDPRSDLYSLGLTIMEILVGYEMIRDGIPISNDGKPNDVVIEMVRSTLGRDVAEVFRIATDLEMEKRYESVEKFKQALCGELLSS